MAVPKKRTSKSKKNIRKNAWKQKILKQATRSVFLAKYLLTNKPEDGRVEQLLTRIRDQEEITSTVAVTSEQNS